RSSAVRDRDQAVEGGGGTTAVDSRSGGLQTVCEVVDHAGNEQARSGVEADDATVGTRIAGEGAAGGGRTLFRISGGGSHRCGSADSPGSPEGWRLIPSVTSTTRPRACRAAA